MKKTIIYKRSVILVSVFMLFYSVLIIRMAVIQSGEMSQLAAVQSEKEILLGESRGYIYDRNHIPLVNDTEKYYSAYISSENSNHDNVNADVNIKGGICYAKEIDSLSEVEDDSVKYTLVERYGGNICSHLIGYVDADGYGVSGIEKAFDRILDESSGSIKISYIADGNGNAFSGHGIEVINENYNSPAGVVLTIDKQIQTIAEAALRESDIECGAVVILNADTSEILASASVPVFDRTNMTGSLNNDKRPFVNRAISAYPVGSVFKPFVAAAAIDKGMDFTDIYICTGSIDVGENTFNCYNSKAHGLIDLNSAIENSCNCYFINAGIRTGKDLICDTASSFGFGKQISLCSAITSDKGNFTSAHEISSDSQLANLCFGQGELLATPLQLAAAYCVLANGGVYNKPVLLRELVDSNNKVYGYYKTEEGERVIDEEICDIINSCLYNNMLNGTGINAQPECVSAAGKTATAQTGIFEEGEENLCTWFAGFFPYESPEFVIVVFNEKGSAASLDCAPVFKYIADGILDYTRGDKS